MYFFLFLTLLAGSLLFAENAAASAGKRYPSEKHVIVDRVTGHSITVLTSSQFNDSKPSYSRRHSWSADGNWVVFTSNRAEASGRQIFAVNETTGDIVQLTNSQNVGRFCLSSKEMKLYYLRTQQAIRQAVELNIGELLDDSMNGQLKAPSAYERVVTELPLDLGQFSLDADDTYLYWGGHTDGTSVIHKINIQTGKIDKILDIDFQIGHLQANPWTPGEIFFCKETGGDADQRTWTARSDGSNFRPAYVETPDEWVTHETVTGPDELMFIISGHYRRLRDKPSGIAVINMRTNEMMLLGQTPVEDTGRPELTGGFWHCHGSPDGRWAVGDTFLGSIILIDRATGEQILLSTAHPMRPDHAHPTFSRDSKRILIQSALLTDGKNLNLMVLNVPY